MTIKALVFDAYGTLFDVHTVIQKCEQFFPGKGRRISEIWRQKQLEYTWLRSLMGRYEDFWHVTDEALLFTLKHLELDTSEEVRKNLMDQYLKLNPYPEVPQALEKFKNKQLAILSNGSFDMLNSIVVNAHLSNVFNQVISVDELKVYKPFMGVYELAVTKLDVKKEEILFITSNSWDASGAKVFGFQVCWINRFNKQFDELGVQPDMIIGNLDELFGI